MVRLSPYALAAARHADATRHHLPAAPAPAGPAIADTVREFFDAMDIGHPGARARVLTAIAHTMTRRDIDDAVARLGKDHADRARDLEAACRARGMAVPDVLLDHARTVNAKVISLLLRARPSRPA